MLFVDNENVTDPRLNLAIEEHLLRDLKTSEDLLLFYIDEPSVIVGRNQNTLEEINQNYVEAQGMHVVRRLSGGGTVYHDLGNLNFSFILRRGKENLVDYRKFTAPVVQALVAMGIPAEFDGRNGLLLGGRKISGCASYSMASGMVMHGTLLFDADLTRLQAALQVKPGQVISKGIKSVRSQVTNLREHLKEPMDFAAFRRRLLLGLFAGCAEIPRYPLSVQDWQAIRRLAEERYMTWEWNWGRSPDFTVQKTAHFPRGEITAQIHVQHGLIHAIDFHSDLFSQEDFKRWEQRLVGARYERQSLAAALAGEGALAEFLELLY